MIKQAALSLCVIGASGAYVWSQSATSSGSDLAEASPAPAAIDPTAVAAVAVEPPLIVREPANSGSQAATAPLHTARRVRVQSISIDPGEAESADSGEDESVHPDESAADRNPTPLRAESAPRIAAQVAVAPRAIKASAKAVPKPSRHVGDGTFDGPAVDAFYGEVQVQVDIHSGQIADIKVLRYPSDRRVSVAINRHALPILRSEAVTAQSADVDIVSGATLTSEAFIESLAAALKQAKA